jgi:outer membrane biogenesis lipoprotein LolB
MRSRFLILVLGIAAFMLSACGGGALPITPAPDRPTFLFFYTDG